MALAAGSHFDVAVLGGGYAGLSAALQLARARRAVAVVDAGERRNRMARHAHGFLGRDGDPPGDIAREGREQLLAYPGVQWVEGRATAAERSDNGFLVDTDQGRVSAARLVLALGIVDELPALEGVDERWGRRVFHCPYCHGHELARRPDAEPAIGVLAAGDTAVHQALLLTDWGRVTLLPCAGWQPDAEQQALLKTRDVVVEAVPADRLLRESTVELADGRRLDFAGLFTQTRTRVASPIPEALGCEMSACPTGVHIHVDAAQATSVPGVWACGDVARASGSVALAVGEGALAGIAAHQSLVLG